MEAKYEEDWSETTSYIAENMTISFKHEYRRPRLTSRCGVTSDVINIKTTFLGQFATIFLFMMSK